MHIKVDDTVEVITGDDSGARSRVIRVLASEKKVIVEGVNQVYKHMRRSQRNPQGGRLQKDMPISISNVLIVCESCNQPARTGARYNDDGSKERYCKKCGAGGGLLSPPKAAYSKK